MSRNPEKSHRNRFYDDGSRHKYSILGLISPNKNQADLSANKIAQAAIHTGPETGIVSIHNLRSRRGHLTGVNKHSASNRNLVIARSMILSLLPSHAVNHARGGRTSSSIFIVNEGKTASVIRSI